jgi:hypothetical protein
LLIVSGKISGITVLFFTGSVIMPNSLSSGWIAISVRNIMIYIALNGGAEGSDCLYWSRMSSYVSL